MSRTPFPPSGQQASHPTALAIEPVLPHLLALLSALSHLGFDTTVAETYEDVRTSLGAQRPTLLATGLKLREYNGLHLVLRGMSAWPDLAAIVTSDAFDPVLQAEAEKLGATFVVMPTSHEELVAAICRTVLRQRTAGIPPEPIKAPFERRTAGPGWLVEAGGSGTTPERRVAVADRLRALVL